MAKKKVVWSIRAQQDRFNILEYWIQRTHSKSYANTLNHLFNKATNLISEYPDLGKPTDFQNVRVKIVKDYLMFYQQALNHLEILVIWDSRQSPRKLETLITKKT